MKSGSLSQPNTGTEDLDATRRTSPQGHPDPTIPTPYAQIIYPCTDAPAQRTLPSYTGVCHLYNTDATYFPTPAYLLLLLRPAVLSQQEVDFQM